MKSIGYIRSTEARVIKRERKALQAHGCDYIVDDGDFDAAVRLIREGRALVVADSASLGASSQQIARALGRVHAAGGHVVDLSMDGRDSRDAEVAALMGARLKRRPPIPAKTAREMATRHDDATRERARAAWDNHRLSQAQAAAEAGVSAATMFRWFGPRGLRSGPIVGSKSRKIKPETK